MICDTILHGASYKDAAESVGIDYNTFNEWRKKGELEQRGKYRDFRDAVRRADAECAKMMVRVIQTAAAKGDWRAALEWLKRRRRDEWGDSVELGGDLNVRGGFSIVFVPDDNQHNDQQQDNQAAS